MSLPLLEDDCTSVAEVLAKAKAVLDRRREMFRTPPAVSVKPIPSLRILELSADPLRKFQWSVAIEVARQLGIPVASLKGGADAMKTIPLTQYRQLAVALALHLTGKSTIAIGKSFDLDHTSVMHARTKMAPIIAAVGMTEDDSLPAWVAASLPYLFVYIEYLRREKRNIQRKTLRKQLNDITT